MITSEELFRSRFSQFEPALIDAVLSKGSVKEVEAGTVLLRSGDPILSTMLIIDGRVKIYREDENGGEFMMYYLEPGNACAFSVMCAISGEQSQISAIAETDCTLIAVPFDSVGKWMGNFSTWDQFIIQNYRRRFEELLMTVDQIAFHSMDQRLLFYLKRKQSVEGDIIKISHQEIARDLNSAREVVSRLLKKMEGLGAVSLERNQIEIQDLDLAM